ncbi:perlucin-like [Mytilus galloprovincialis]|uniref:perlucin-like n=1 Tax=Mytilus galloprovincialis TaxID=29158 RepID=UPI003F7B7C61
MEKLCLAIGLVLTLGLIDSLNAACPQGWTNMGGSCYIFNDEKMTWHDAMEWCKSKGGYLAEINDKQESDQLEKVAAGWHVRNITQFEFFWLGAHDEQTEGVWVWETSQKRLTYTDWYPGEPNSFQGHEEDCLALFSLTSFHWVDYECQKLTNFICESPSSVTSTVAST